MKGVSTIVLLNKHIRHIVLSKLNLLLLKAQESFNHYFTKIWTTHFLTKSWDMYMSNQSRGYRAFTYKLPVNMQSLYIRDNYYTWMDKQIQWCIIPCFAATDSLEEWWTDNLHSLINGCLDVFLITFQPLKLALKALNCKWV